jgi:arogenate dehydrogenase (NADP+)
MKLIASHKSHVCHTCHLSDSAVYTRPYSRQSHAGSQSTFRVTNIVLGKSTKALDAAMSFDTEAKLKEKLNQSNKLVIGIVGFGNFGQFLASRFVKAGHTVIGTSRGDYTDAAEKMGATFYEDLDDFCEQHPDVVILSSSILSLDSVVRKLPVQRLKRSTLFVDVLSVKVFPKNLLLDVLPDEVDILCTHPMFGPDSGRGSWEGLNFMFEKVRVSDTEDRKERVETFLDFFRQEGCRMVEMTCEEHDRDAASTQFITHSVGRTLGAMNLKKTEIDTKGYESLLSLVENTANDSFDLYYGLFLYNPNATEELERLEKAFDQVKRKLFTQLHDKLRENLHINTK